MSGNDQAKKLVAEAKALLEKDLRGGLAKLRQALAIDPDYPELEDEIFLREDAVEKLDNLLDYVVVLLKEHKDYQACQMLKQLPANYIIEDRAPLLGDLTERIARAEELLQRIGSMPKSGNRLVLDLYEEAARLVPDYPGLQEELATVRNSFGRYQGYVDNINLAIRELNFAKAEELLLAFRGVYPDDDNIGKIEVALRNKKTEARGKRRLRKNMAAAGLTAGLVLFLALGYFAYEAMAVRSAGREWERVSRLLTEKKFAEARAGCREIIVQLDKVRLFSRARKVELSAQVDQVMGSEAIRQGAAGRTMVDGVYIAAQDLAQVTSVKGLLTEAADLSGGGRPGEAIVKYEQARQLVEGLEPDLSGRLGGEIEAGMLAAREQLVKALIEQSQELSRGKRNDDALARIIEAATLVKQYELPDIGLAERINATHEAIKLAKLRAMVSVAEQHLAAARYDEALSAYDLAQDFARANKLAVGHEALLAQVRESMVVARLNSQVAKGDKNFQDARWREAINDYSTAIKLHQDSRLEKEPPAYARAVRNRDQAQLAAARDELRQVEREAEQYFGAGEWRKARAAYGRLLSQVDRGGYGQEQDFIRARAAAEARLGEIDERLLIGTQKDYLLERHRSILKKVFNLGGEAAFLDPAVVFLLEDENGLKFSLTARSYERQGNQGKYTFFEVIYAFNRKSGEWSLLGQNTSSRESD